MSSEAKTVKFRIKRYNPELDRHFVSTYDVPVRKGMTILDALLYIKDNLDATLTFRYSCRMGQCGSCGILVNGKPMLACYTQVLHLGTDVVELEPLPNLPVIRDLVVDVKPFFARYRKVTPYLIKPEEELKKPEEFLQPPENFWEIWDLTVCTKCGICFAACPAAIDDDYLGPSALATNYRFLRDVRDEGLNERLDAVSETLWLCTSCNSCSLMCPKNVDGSTSVVETRSLVVERGYIPRTVKEVLESAFTYHNPLRTSQAKRLGWAEGLNVKLLPEVGSAEYLYFVCCSAAFDPRNQEIARSTAVILREIGVDFANLGKEEWCCGDHILRMGEKGLFEELAGHNVSMFEKYGVDKVITVSPHCFNTMKNDKPYTDLDVQVYHYTQIIADAIDTGRLKPTREIRRRVAYHDPCFLGKRNNIYEEPRKILESIPGLELIEFRRRLENSYCCGGGAGRVWVEEAPPEKRPCVERVREAVEIGAEVIAVACPFCMTTLEDAVKVLEVEDKIVVKDISELVREACGL